jgi:hypothetical protein
MPVRYDGAGGPDSKYDGASPTTDTESLMLETQGEAHGGIITRRRGSCVVSALDAAESAKEGARRMEDDARDRLDGGGASSSSLSHSSSISSSDSSSSLAKTPSNDGIPRDRHSSDTASTIEDDDRSGGGGVGVCSAAVVARFLCLDQYSSAWRPRGNVITSADCIV